VRVFSRFFIFFLFFVSSSFFFIVFFLFFKWQKKWRFRSFCGFFRFSHAPGHCLKKTLFSEKAVAVLHYTTVSRDFKGEKGSPSSTNQYFA